MTRITITSKIGPDGVLHLNVPISMLEANREVRVTIEPLPALTRPAMTQEEWGAFFQSVVESISEPEEKDA